MRRESSILISGFTVIEIVIGTTLLAILAGFLIYALNPAGQLAGSRNKERLLHLQSIMIAVKQNIAESPTGAFQCAAGPFPTSTARPLSSSAGGYNIGPCLIPNFADTLPYDPSVPAAHFANKDDYDTGYVIKQDASTGQIILSAPAAELGAAVQLVR